ncbi:ATP-binding protein [Variovorax sp.]|uniref:sensor histidine kinase n=1 Tax=Variovorax sp. TaxID=1871043 RepID=UPI003BA9AF60
MAIRCIAAALLLCAASWLAGPADAATLRIDDAATLPLVLDEEVELLEDPGGQLSREDADASTRFQPGTHVQMRQGFTNSAFWLRLAVVNDTGTVQPLRLVLNATWLQHVDFHMQRGNGTAAARAAWVHEQAGVSVPLHGDRDRVPTLSLDLQPGEQARLLVRVQSHSNLKFAPQLHTADGWREAESCHALLDGLLIGGLLVLAVYSLTLWLISRNPLMASQSLGFTLVALYEATYRGHARIALWPDSIDWSYRAAGVVAGCSVLSLLLYLHVLSRRGPVRPPGLPVIAVLAASQVVAVLGTLLGPYAPFARLGNLTVLLLVFTLTASSFFYMRRAGPGGKLAFPVMTIIMVGVCLRLTELSLPTHMLPGFDAYALGFPGMLVGLVALSSWTHHLSRQQHLAQRTLVLWQADEQQRLRDEVARKTHALNAALEQAEHQAREQTRLMAYVSHDLRAPLATIIGHVRMLRDEMPHPPERLQAIERSATYQLSLINDLLDYAKGELLPFSFELRPVRLQALLDDIAQYADTLAQRRNNAFELEVQGALPRTVLIDCKRFHQLLLNLLSNAAKFTHGGKIGLRVRARPRADSWRLQFEVWDSGCGIDLNEQAHIRQAFAQGAPSASGNGLGLVIARRIVQRMGGRLLLMSHPNLGTRVRFSVIVKDAPEEPRSVATQAPPQPLQSSRLRLRRPPTPVPTVAPLPAAVRAELETFARDGRWTDLHEWADRLEAADSRHEALVDAVRQALDRLDFEHIRLLARATPKL